LEDFILCLIDHTLLHRSLKINDVFPVFPAKQQYPIHISLRLLPLQARLALSTQVLSGKIPLIDPCSIVEHDAQQITRRRCAKYWA
jgi:hypothetical protein